MSAYFQNTLLPGARAADVCAAFTDWYVREGYETVTRRPVFDCRYVPDEVRLFVISNDRWSVVLHSADLDGTTRVLSALSHFPVVAQLWGKDGGWGYRLAEKGQLVTSFCSKRGLESPGDAPARQPGDADKVASACGVPNAAPRLACIQSGRFLFNDKPCGEFAAELGVPMAALNFHDVDVPNAGLLGERTIDDGWNCRMLCFEKKGASEPVHFSVDNMLAELSAEDRAQVGRMQKRIKWVRLITAPIGCVTTILALPLGLVFGAAIMLSGIPGVRKIFLGKGVLARDAFVARLTAAEPERISLRGQCATNTRHSCTVTARPPLQVLPKLAPRKGGRFDEHVFDIEMESDFISCIAYPHGREPEWLGVETLEQRTMAGDSTTIQFEKRRTIHPKHQWFQYAWTLKTTPAVYRFHTSRKEEFTPEQLENLESMVRSFQLLRTES